MYDLRAYRLWLYPPSDAAHLYPVAGKDGSRSAAPPFQAPADLPPAVQETFAKVAHARPVEINLQAGDLLYLPACWWHCVEGSRERNMILNWWMHLHPSKFRAGDERPVLDLHGHPAVQPAAKPPVSAPAGGRADDDAESLALELNAGGDGDGASSEGDGLELEANGDDGAGGDDVESDGDGLELEMNGGGDESGEEDGLQLELNQEDEGEDEEEDGLALELNE